MLIEFDEKKEKLAKLTEKIALIDFYATWCGPCMMMKPIIEAMSKKPEFKDINFIKINVDHNPETAEKFGVMSIPAFFVFKKGKQTHNFIGTVSEQDLKEKLK